MEATIKGGYILAELSQHDCQLLALACRVARRSDDEPGLKIPRAALENLATLLTFGAVALSAHFNMCPQDMADHLDHLTQPTPGLDLSSIIL